MKKTDQSLTPTAHCKTQELAMKQNANSLNRTLIVSSLLMTAISTAQVTHAEGENIGGIITDGTAGAIQTLSKPTDVQPVKIEQNLGITQGGNLFHSFDQFNVNANQNVTFSENTPGALSNIISRVTGGNQSDINGTISTDAGSRANVYLLNPAGIVFGKDAKLDVAGAFYASTANQLIFTDGGLVNADKTQGSSLSSVEPASFGFLASTAANNGLLRVEGATLAVNPGQTLDLVAGKIEADSATLGVEQDTVDEADPETAGREIRLVAMQGAGTVSLERPNSALPLPIATPSATNAGSITLQDTAIIASGNGGGRIGVWGGNVNISTQDASKGINSVNTGSRSAAPQQGIEMKTGNLTLDGITVRANTKGSGNAGNIRLQASQDTILRQGGRIISATIEKSTGNTGNLSLLAGRDLIVDGLNSPEFTSTSLSTNANSDLEGNTGDVYINTGRDVLISNGGKIYSFVTTNSAGNVNINAGRDVLLNNGGLIYSDTASNTKGNTGDVAVMSGRDMMISHDSLIYSSSEENKTGNTGNVNLHAQGNFQIDNGSQIYSTIGTNSKAGIISATANGNVIVDGQILFYVGDGDRNADRGTLSVTAGGDLTITPDGVISSETLGNRSAANIAVSAGRQLTVNGYIQSSNTKKGSIGAGNAGNLLVHADGDISINGSSGNGKIYSLANQSNNGNAGNIDVSTNGKLTLINQGFINAKTESDGGHAGDVNVNVQGDILLDHKSQIFSSTFSKANAGNVSVVSSYGNLTVSNSSGITTATHGAGTGGNVVVGAKGNVDLLSGGLINSGANSFSNNGVQYIASGNSGNVSVTAQTNITINNSIIKADTNDTGNAGNVKVSAAGDLVIKNTGILGSYTTASGNANNVDIIANNILLENGFILSGVYKNSGGTGQAGNINISFGQWLTADTNSFIDTISLKGNGGAITIRGGELLSLRNSSLETTAEAQGNGGNINVTADILLMDTGLIRANATRGNGGDINLYLKAIIPSGDSLTEGGPKVDWDSALPTFNVIQAFSQRGVSGVPNITAPQLNLSGVLSNFGAPQFDSSILSPDYCNLGAGSTLSRKGRGGLLPKGDDVQF